MFEELLKQWANEQGLHLTALWRGRREGFILGFFVAAFVFAVFGGR